MRLRFPSVVLAALLPVAAACTLGPDPNLAPVTAADQAEGFVAASGDAAGEPEVDHWWVSFADQVTCELVEAALAGNTDLRAAAARVLEAEAGLRAARGASWPQVSLAASATRSKSSFVLPGAGRVGIRSTTFSDELAVSYQVDLFGRLTRTRQASWAELLAARADRETVVHSLVADVVRARVRIAGLERQLELANRTVASWRSTAAIIEDRYRWGLVDAAEMHLNRQSLAAAEAVVPDLERQLAAARHGLDVLLGVRPGTGPALPATLPPVPELDAVPVGLPAELLDRRPDLRASRWRLGAATARVGVAMADLFPSLSLTGSAGNRSDALGDLLDSETLVYTAVANLVAPIFTGGQRRAEVRAAQARAEQAAASHAAAVLNALREVEDALVSEQAVARQLAARRVQLESAAAAEELARSRYHAGTGGLLELLVADRARSSAETALISNRTAQWEARVALLLALGGDWIPETSEA